MTQDEPAAAGPAADPPTPLQQPGRPTADPPTRLQQPGRPAADAPAGATPDPTRLQSAPRQAGPADPGRYIPAELRERYVIGERLGAGGEATVWLAHAVDEPDVPIALKVYRPDVTFDEDLRRQLDNPSLHRYVPKLYGYGVVSPVDSIQVGWEAMEYFPLGTLADLNKRQALVGTSPDAPRLRAVVAELVAAFDFWENTVHRRQTDVSPSNILVRSDDRRPKLVLGDFGGVLGTGISKRFAELRAKAAYMSPEALAGLNDPGGPYWSLGAICFQLLTGRLIYGSDLTEDTIRVALLFEEPDVSDLPKAWQDLVAGLLTRRPEDRWGAAEVRDWLAGRAVPVRRRSSGAARLPITFASTPYTDPVALAAAMADSSDQAADWLSGVGATRLADWLTNELAEKRFDRQVLLDIGRDRVAAHVAVAAFAATYLPGLPPRYRGTAVTVERIRALAGDPARRPLLVEMIRRGVLPYAARHHCEHADCPDGDGCQRLSALGRLLPRAVTAASASLAAVSKEFGSREARQAASAGPGGRVLDPAAAERDVCAAAVLLVTNAKAVTSLRQRLLVKRGPGEPWWQLRRQAALKADPATADGIAAMVVADTLHPFALDYRRALAGMRRAGIRERVGGPVGTRLRAVAGRVATRLDDRAGQRTMAWFAVVFLAALETLGLAPVVRSWPPTDAELSKQIARGVAALRPHMPDVVTDATDPLGAWLPVVLAEPRQWVGPVIVAATVVTCLALIRKTGGHHTGARLVRALAALAGRVVMTAYLLHLAVKVFAPSVKGLTATAPLIVIGVGVGVVILFRALTGPRRLTARSTASWPVRVLVTGGVLALILVLLQQVPLPHSGVPAGTTPGRTTTPRSAK